MDEFVVLLVIAVVIIGVMMAFGTPLADWAEGNFPSGPGGGTGGPAEFSSFDLGRVGFSENEASRKAEFGSFTVGQTQSETLKSMATLGVSQGYMGGDGKKFEIDVPSHIREGLKEVKIRFDLDESNLYGNLVIKWNDEVIFEKVANLNRYVVTVDAENVKPQNSLEVLAGGPGLYFWAATIYSLRDFEVTGEYGPEKFVSFEIYSNEIEAWNRGILKFYTTSNQKGEIAVKLNGNEIFRAKDPSHVVEEEYDYSDIGNDLKIGDNILSFKADSVFSLDDVEFQIFLSTNSLVKERDFDLSAPDMTLVQNSNGKISFDVQSVYRQGALAIKLNDNQLNVHSVREGENTIEFTSDDVKEGTNTIQFSGTGSWEINDVVIGAGS